MGGRIFSKNYFVGGVLESGYPEYNGLVWKFKVLIKIT